MNKQRLPILAASLGVMAWGGLVPVQALPIYTPIVLNTPTPQADAYFGAEGAGVGDMNGDGVPDLEVGAPWQDVGGNDAQGQAFVFSGADRKRLLTLNTPTPQADAHFGWSVAGMGDVNGDGVPDLLVAAPDQDVGGNGRQGQVFVFSGATGSLLRTLNTPTPQADAYFGAEVAGVGDMNGDGVPDVLVGADGQTVGGNDAQGQVFVFSGATGRRLLTLNNPMPQYLALFGSEVAGVGDVNRDGVPDLLVGAPYQDVGFNAEQGQVFVFSGATGQRLLTLNDPMSQAEAYFGWSVAGVGDVNGDKVPDVVVGAPGLDYDPGRAFVFSGATGGLLHTLRTPTPQWWAYFGESVTGVGDMSGDGVPDLLVGAPGQTVGGNDAQGQVFVFSGATGGLLRTLNNLKPQANTSFGLSVAGVGDVNWDGVPDLLVGASGQTVGGNDAQGQVFLFVSGPSTPPWVALNILPKQINVQTQDVLPVAILTTAKFNVTQVNPLSVRLGPGKAQEIHRQGHRRDVDGDGDIDLVLHFRTQAIGLGCGEQTVKLTGQTVAGQPIQGVDRLTVVGCQ